MSAPVESPSSTSITDEAVTTARVVLPAESLSGGTEVRDKVVTATEDTPVDRIADLLQSHRIKRVPIVKDGKVVGVVSRADVIRAMARSPAEMSRSH